MPRAMVGLLAAVRSAISVLASQAHAGHQGHLTRRKLPTAYNARPDLTPSRLRRVTLVAHLSYGWPRPSACYTSRPPGPARRRCALNRRDHQRPDASTRPRLAPPPRTASFTPSMAAPPR
jgi:hypothetical protein